VNFLPHVWQVSFSSFSTFNEEGDTSSVIGVTFSADGVTFSEEGGVTFWIDPTRNS
jgi:hypothetical protein